MNERSFAERLKMLRKRKGFSQKRLAEDLEISTSTIGMLETGKRNPSTELYEAIADYFNVDIDFLFGRTDIERREFINEIDGSLVRQITVDDFFLGDKKDNIEFAKRGGKIILNEENSKRFMQIQELMADYRNMSDEDQDITYKLIQLYLEGKKNEN